MGLHSGRVGFGVRDLCLVYSDLSVSRAAASRMQGLICRHSKSEEMRPAECVFHLFILAEPTAYGVGLAVLTVLRKEDKERQWIKIIEP